MKKVAISSKIMETAWGIFIRVAKSNKGARTNDKKTARKKGKSTGFARRSTTPPIKTTIITKEAVATLFPSMCLTSG
jgi:hypothetical protein